MFTDQLTAYLQTIQTAVTRQTYHLSQFHDWYTASYGEEPDAALLSGEEAREC